MLFSPGIGSQIGEDSKKQKQSTNRIMNNKTVICNKYQKHFQKQYFLIFCTRSTGLDCDSEFLLFCLLIVLLTFDS